jgi:hypothetical protein
MTLAIRMTHMRPHHRRTLGLTVAAISRVAMCACQGTSPVCGRELFDSVKPGMSCAEVESLLGRPVLRYCTVAPPGVGNDEAWYLPPPEIGPVDSPWGPGTIGVVYAMDNRVVSKRLNPQWREPPNPHW